MIYFISQVKWLCAVSLFVGVAACSENTNLESTSNSAEKSSGTVTLDVYKSRTCGCCKKWIEHIEASGFDAKVHHPTDLNKVKSDNGIASRYQSCHTAISADGYVFEGHIPAQTIERFLSEKPPNAIGLAVPGMPMGSPGMEMGNRHDDYDVLLLKKDGNVEVYEHISAEHSGGHG
jgi:hypothetical protein